MCRHYLYLKRTTDTAPGTVEATLAMGAERYPIPAIYLPSGGGDGLYRPKTDGNGQGPFLLSLPGH